MVAERIDVEIRAMDELIEGDTTSHSEHFKYLGMKLGLRRIFEIHEGLVLELKRQANENKTSADS